MNLTPKIVGTWLFLWLGAMLSLVLPVRAEVAVYMDSHGELRRIAPDASSTIYDLETFDLGALHYDFQDFDFDAGGILWGITDRDLYRLDPQSALSQEVGPFGLFTRIERSDLAVAPDGTLWMAQVPEGLEETILYTVARDTGRATEVSRFSKKFQGVTFLGEELIAVSFAQLYKVDAAAVTLEPLGLQLSGASLGNLFHLDSLGDRLFASVLFVVAPPLQLVVELFPETGTLSEVAASFGAGLALREETCTPSPTALCFGNGRFEVTATWRDFADNEGQGERLPWTSADSGLFQFFGADNWELLVKVLDGCAVNDRVWVLASASTNVELSLTVRDTVSGDIQVYDNPLGNPAGAILDDQAFDACP